MIRRWTLFLPLALFALIAGLALYQLGQPRDPAVPSGMVGKPVPDFALPPALPDGEGLTDEDLRDGKARLVNIWASWCLPCIAEAPQLEQLAEEGVDIVGVAIDDEPADIRQFLADHGNPFSRIAADDYSRLQLALGSSGIPETFVVDGDGIITHQHIGDVRPEHLPALREELRAAGG
jgi:cytochrome c biogenesis protein CcmG/thiol:disulfide interchange protein DsbE